ncbi:1-phosphofructokinase family hexose kinase [Mycolicibacterium sp. J2]|uniref:1-phosphofructokinase family hexose kinase n=1 Tax=Mycolicibacterium sp. J2 TaxID=2993511 RepID=UPI00224A6442|nr:1-phosphofructokinase family hexose kinase [Mycolicibacterium sp. J2]MCX2715605.1 1-phosphofructokinase family hexose kinase [Mycolicibacterium sp. J2]
MPVILTLTMNPALDVTVEADRVQPTDKIRCRAERYDAGGGGVNVARFAHAMGADVLAVLTVGGPTGKHVVELIDAASVPNVPVAVQGITRQSLTVNEGATGQQYRFVLPGPVLTAGEQRRCLDLLADAAAPADFVVASGSLPPGVAPDFYQRVADICRGRNARLVVDTSGGGLTQLTSGVFLLKPSVRELRECVGRPLDCETEQVAAARGLIDAGRAEVVVVSLGAEGVLVVTARESSRLSAMPVTAVSGVGAGDALVAGVVVGLARGWPLPTAVRYGIAAATAKLGTPGTSAFSRAEVDCLFDGFDVTVGR